MTKLLPYMKALAGFLVPFATQILAALQDGSQGGSTITQAEWLTAALTSLVAGGAVWAVPNKDPQALHQAESVQPPRILGKAREDGYGAVDLLIVVLVVLFLIWLVMQVF